MIIRLCGPFVSSIARSNTKFRHERLRLVVIKELAYLLDVEKEDENHMIAGDNIIIPVKNVMKTMLLSEPNKTLGIIYAEVGKIVLVKESMNTSIKRYGLLFQYDGSFYSFTSSNTKFINVNASSTVFNTPQMSITVLSGIRVRKNHRLHLKLALINFYRNVKSNKQIHKLLHQIININKLYLINKNTVTKLQKSNNKKLTRLDNTCLPKLRLNSMIDQNTLSKDQILGAKTLNLEVQITTTLKPSSPEHIIRPFINKDKFSCYANSIIQCLYSCDTITQLISNGDCGTLLKNHLEEYTSTSNKKIMSTLSIREFLGPPFTSEMEQCCIEFLEALLSKCPSINDLFKFNYKHTFKCKPCGYCWEETDANNSIYRIFIPTSEDMVDAKVEKFQMESLHSFQQNEKIAPCFCPRCKDNKDITCTTKITNDNQYLCIQLMAFDENNEKIDIKIDKVKDSKIVIGSTTFVPKCAVFHMSDFTNAGHYIAYIKAQEKGKPKKPKGRHKKIGTGWVCVDDDNITLTRWPNQSKNLHAIIMEKE